MKNTLFILFAIFLSLSAFAYQDSIPQVTSNNDYPYQFAKGDTLADLNRMLGGVNKTEIAKEVIIPQGILISELGVITVSDPLLLTKKSYSFEIKAYGANNEVYIVNFKLKIQNNIPVISVITDKIDMATGLRKDGMIWVVVLVSMILFSVILIYLFLLDRKTARLRKMADNN